MFTFCKARWVRWERNRKKIMQLKLPTYQKPKDKNMGWTKQLNQLRHKNKLYISAGKRWNAGVASLIEVHLDDLSYIFLHFQVPFFLDINSCEAWEITIILRNTLSYLIQNQSKALHCTEIWMKYLSQISTSIII